MTTMDSFSGTLGLLRQIATTTMAIGLAITLNLLIIYITWRFSRTFVEKIFPSTAASNNSRSSNDTKPTAAAANGKVSSESTNDADALWYSVLIVALFLTLLWSATAVFVEIKQMDLLFLNCFWATIVVLGIAVGVAASVVAGTLAIKGVVMT